MHQRDDYAWRLTKHCANTITLDAEVKLSKSMIRPDGDPLQTTVYCNEETALDARAKL